MTALLVRWGPATHASVARRLIGEALLDFGPTAGNTRLARHCRRCGSTGHGRPVLVPQRPGDLTPHVSISRAADLTVVAVTDAGPVGVDVEVTQATRQAGFDPITWVRTESLVKATGHGFGVDPGHVRLTESHQPPGLVRWTGAEPPAGPVWMFDLVITPAHVAAVTVLAERSPSPPTVRRADPEGRPRPASR